MAPEQLRAERVDGRADQFAWGVVAYELLAGRPPWNAPDGVGLVANILTQPAPDVRVACPDLPVEAATAIERALAKDARDRFESMNDVVGALAPFAGEAATPPRAPAARPEARPAPRPAPSLEGRAYSTAELRTIIQRALEKEARTGYGYRDIVDAAREVGVDEGAVRLAARDLAAEGWVPPAEARGAAKRKLLRHVAVWAVVSAFLLLFSLITKGEIHRAFLIAIAGWAMGVGLQAVNYVLPEQKADKKKRRALPPGLDDERIEVGAEAFATAMARIRVAPPAAAMLRVASGPGDDGEAEREAERDAAASADEARARRR
jgi:serine/threonine-protein kinase